MSKYNLTLEITASSLRDALDHSEGVADYAEGLIISIAPVVTETHESSPSYPYEHVPAAVQRGSVQAARGDLTDGPSEHPADVGRDTENYFDFLWEGSD
jgi:hypothetical protein